MAGESKRESYGIVEALINDATKTITLTLRRKRQPLFDGEVCKVLNWALRSVTNKYPGYIVEFQQAAS